MVRPAATLIAKRQQGVHNDEFSIAPGSREPDHPVKDAMMQTISCLTCLVRRPSSQSTGLSVLYDRRRQTQTSRYSDILPQFVYTYTTSLLHEGVCIAMLSQQGVAAVESFGKLQQCRCGQHEAAHTPVLLHLSPSSKLKTQL